MAVETHTDQEILDALRDALYGGLTRKAARITINGRTIESFSVPELIDAIKAFEGRVLSDAQQRPSVGSFRSPS